MNYGIGNIAAFIDIYKKLNINVNVASNRLEIMQARRLILPGVGSFDWAMNRLNSSGMRDTLDELVLDKGIPILGICVGMQMMARASKEGVLSGLNWIPGEVILLGAGEGSLRKNLPHMGWNDVKPMGSDILFKGLPNSRFYFLHSYCYAPDNVDNILSITDYGVNFSSSIKLNNIYGTQFHPEKSHHWGVTLLKNFSEI